MEISEIKHLFPILTVLEHYGIKPNKNNLAKCPFHDDKTASLQIYPATNTWHCFGCGKGTDNMDFIKYSENCTTHEAILKANELLNVRANVRATFTVAQSVAQNDKSMETPAITTTPVPEKKRILGLSTAFKYFSQTLKATAKAQEYLKNRAIDYTKITVGYDNNNFHQIKKTGKELQELYLQLGLIYPDRQGRKDNYHSRFDNCIVFPTFDEAGNIVSMYGRKTDIKEGEGGPSLTAGKHYKLPGEHLGLYPKYPEPNTEILLITECIIDCATLLQHHSTFNIQNLSFLSLYGAKIWTEEHTKAIGNLHQLKEIIFALDGDEQGKEGTLKHAETVKQINPKIKTSYLEIMENEDINSIAQGHSPEVFTELINNRKPITNENHFFLSPEKKENGTTAPQIKGNGKPDNHLPVKEKNTNVQYPSNGHHRQGALNTSNPNNITYETDRLFITLCGGIELYNLKRLRATLHIQLKVNVYKDYRDTIDLYSNSQRKRLMQELSETLEISTNEISKAITELTNGLEQYRNNAIERKRKEAEAAKEKDKETFTQQEFHAGEKLLNHKTLMKETYRNIKQIGLTGQEKNGMLLFFIYLTRMFKEPLHALVQGSSNAGKTYLLKKIINLLPKLHCKIITGMSENALFYVLEGLLKHVVLLLEDLQGSYKAFFVIRELMTNISLRKWITVSNPKTGELEQKELFVEGPTSIAGATTEDKIYEDNANRSFQIQIDENTERTNKILDRQLEEAAGLIDNEIESLIQRTFKTAQLQLKPVEVIIPFAKDLKIPEYIFKKHRTNKHYITLIKAIAFWHQKQRKWKTDKRGNPHIEATLEDVWWANYLSKESLLRKSDELSPQLRSFFESVKEDLQINKQKSFLSKPVREFFRMNPMKLNRYLHELDARGYIKQTGGNKRTGYEYEIKVWGDYEQLQKGVEILDKILSQIAQKQNLPIDENQCLIEKKLSLT